MSAAMGGNEDNHVEPMLPAYALGALEPDERLHVEQHLATCAACRAEAATYGHVVDSLGAGTPLETPPPELKARILAVATGQPLPADDRVTSLGTTEPRSKASGSWRSNRPIVVLSAASILLLIGVVVLGVLLARTTDERDDAVSAQKQLEGYLGAGGQVVAMTSLDAANWGSWQGAGNLLSAPGKPTMVVVNGCPPTTSNRVYRVWVARNGDRTGVGEMKVDDSGWGWLKVDAPDELSKYDQLGITVVTNDDQRDDMMITAL
jgi:hypothetical protein